MKLSVLLVLCALSPSAFAASEDETPVVRYRVDLSDPTDDLFHVTMQPGPLEAQDRHLDFVAFAPGVHSPLHFGRFVQSIAAYDAEGAEIAIERKDTNRWELSEPTRVARIAYVIEDTFDAEVEGSPVMGAAGTGIEPDYVVINNFGLLPYFERQLMRPVELTIEHEESWLVGTALKEKDGVLHAPSYRALADSPILMGALTTTAIWVGDIEVEIFVHSNNPGLHADEVLFLAGENLEAAERFIGFAPVDRYVFLMMFFDMQTLQRNRMRSMGALEHNTSSLYALPDFGGTDTIASVIAHEFMHICTPLHLKSTIIANFDYSIPTTDRHVWLYEGITEWSAHTLRLRSEIIDLEQYLGILAGKIRTARQYDPEYSLTRISAEWSTPDGNRQYGNIYQLGALTGVMLDIRLLELSGGERGLREVFFTFLDRYGMERPFDDETFFEEFVAETYPEIGDFLERHVIGNEPLPYAETFAKVGVTYSANGPPMTLDEGCSEEAAALRAAWTRSLLE